MAKKKRKHRRKPKGSKIVRVGRRKRAKRRRTKRRYLMIPLKKRSVGRKRKRRRKTTGARYKVTHKVKRVGRKKRRHSPRRRSHGTMGALMGAHTMLTR